MAVEIPAAGRTRHVKGHLLLVRWIQDNYGVEQLLADLNTLDAAADARSSSSLWFSAPIPGRFDAGETFDAWYGREIRVPFTAVVPSGGWNDFDAALKAFVEETFPGEQIKEPNRTHDFPALSSDANPAKCWDREVEFE